MWCSITRKHQEGLQVSNPFPPLFFFSFLFIVNKIFLANAGNGLCSATIPQKIDGERGNHQATSQRQMQIRQPRKKERKNLRSKFHLLSCFLVLCFQGLIFFFIHILITIITAGIVLCQIVVLFNVLSLCFLCFPFYFWYFDPNFFMLKLFETMSNSPSMIGKKLLYVTKILEHFLVERLIFFINHILYLYLYYYFTPWNPSSTPTRSSSAKPLTRGAVRRELNRHFKIDKVNSWFGC